MIEDLLAMVRIARALAGAPPDDLRRFEYAARKRELLERLERLEQLEDEQA